MDPLGSPPLHVHGLGSVFLTTEQSFSGGHGLCFADVFLYKSKGGPDEASGSSGSMVHGCAAGKLGEASQQD